MLNGMTKVKQIEGLEAQLAAIVAKNLAQDTQLGNINLGGLDLTGKVLTVPFTLPDGTTVNRTIDLSSAMVDINVASATIDPNSYILTITDSDGSAETVNFKTILDNYTAQYIQPKLDLLTNAVGVADAKAVAADAKAVAAQNTADAAEVKASNALSTANSAVTAAAAADAKAVTADTKAVAADAKAVAAQNAANDANDEAQVAQNNAATAQADVDALKPTVLAHSLALTNLATRASVVEAAMLTSNEIVDLVGVATSGDGTAMSNDVLPSTLKIVTGVFVNGEWVRFGNKNCAVYFSKDGGVTPTFTQVGGAKLYWNQSKIGYNVANDDQITVTALK